MAGIMGTKVRNLTFHPGIAIFPFNVGTNCGDQVAHLPDTPIRWSKTESELIGRSHGQEFTAEDVLHLAFGRVIRRRAPQERNIAARHGSAGFEWKKDIRPAGRPTPGAQTPYLRKRLTTYSKIDSTTLSRMEVASGK
jgi:hypothetical protein